MRALKRRHEPKGVGARSGDGVARGHPEPAAVGEASYVRDERSEIGKHLSIGSSLNDRLKHISPAFA